MADNVLQYHRPRDRSAIRARGGGSGVAGLASFSPDFFNNPTLVDPKTGLAIGLVRATTATYTDQDLIVRTALAGQARMQGMRVVRNLFTFTENFNNAAWHNNASPTITTGVTDPLGGNTAFTITAGAANSYKYQLIGNVGSSQRTSCWMRRRTGTGIIYVGDNTALTTQITSAWQRITVLETVAFGSCGFGVNVSGDAIDVWRPQCENVTAQSIQTPGEYQSVGVLATPYQGLGIDGARAYTTLNGNTVASNVVTEATGAVISSAIRQGFLIEPAATQLVTPLASVRDMTNAAWALGATMTRARTQVGMDGVANKATLLTGGAVLATNTILQTLVAAASSRTYSVGLKLVSGTWEITQDGATWTDITSQLNTSTFTVVKITASILNAAFGIRGSIGGQAIADYNQFEAGAVATSRIPDNISVRNADVPTIATGSWFNATLGTLFVKWINATVSGTYVVASFNDTTTANVINIQSKTITTCEADVTVATVAQSALSAVSTTSGTVSKAISSYRANGFYAYANNTTLGTDASGTIPTVTRLELGGEAGATQLNGILQSFQYYPTVLNTVTAQNMTV